MALIENAFFSDSMIADRPLQRQRTGVEDQQERLNNIDCDEESKESSVDRSAGCRESDGTCFGITDQQIGCCCTGV